MMSARWIAGDSQSPQIEQHPMSPPGTASLSQLVMLRMITSDAPWGLLSATVPRPGDSASFVLVEQNDLTHPQNPT